MIPVPFPGAVLDVLALEDLELVAARLEVPGAGWGELLPETPQAAEGALLILGRELEAQLANEARRRSARGAAEGKGRQSRRILRAPRLPGECRKVKGAPGQ